MLHTHTLTIPPTPITDAMGGHYHLTLDHGVELTLNVILVRIPGEPDQISGTIDVGTETRVQDSTREPPPALGPA